MFCCYKRCRKNIFVLISPCPYGFLWGDTVISEALGGCPHYRFLQPSPAHCTLAKMAPLTPVHCLSPLPGTLSSRGYSAAHFLSSFKALFKSF